jgi:hypothetical protein
MCGLNWVLSRYPLHWPLQYPSIQFFPCLPPAEWKGFTKFNNTIHHTNYRNYVSSRRSLEKIYAMNSSVIRWSQWLQKTQNGVEWYPYFKNGDKYYILLIKEKMSNVRIGRYITFCACDDSSKCV